MSPRATLASANRRQVRDWHDGSRIAINFVVHVEEGAQLSPAFGDSLQEPENEASYAIAGGEHEIVADSFYEYGARRGLGRILDLFRDRGLPVTVFAAGRALRTNPAAAAAIAAQGCDVVGEGMRWISPRDLSARQIAQDIDETTACIDECVGVPVRGWCARPPADPTVRDVAARRGLLYDCMSAAHETPYYALVDERPFLVVPLTPDVNDMRFWQNRMFTARDFADYVIQAASNLLCDDDGAVLLTVQVHPRIIGRPGRIGALNVIADWVGTTSGVGAVSRLETAEHWLRRTARDDTWNWPC